MRWKAAAAAATLAVFVLVLALSAPPAVTGWVALASFREILAAI